MERETQQELVMEVAAGRRSMDVTRWYTWRQWLDIEIINEIKGYGVEG